MPLTKGKMDITHERKIKKNLIYLKKNMDAKDLTDYFIQEEVFDFPDIDMIKGFNPNTTESRNDCFFKLLFQSGPNAYRVFLESLCGNGQDFLKDKIEGTHVEGGNTACAALEDASWLADISPAVRNRRLKERDLSKLAPHLGNDWPMVAYDMGLATTDVQHAQMDQHTTTMQIYACLNLWRIRKFETATLDEFIRIVADCNQCTTVNWIEIRNVALSM